MLYEPRIPASSPRPRIAWERLSKDWIRPFTWALLLMLLVNTVFPRYRVEGHSMEPMLQETERLFTINIDLVPQLRRGQLVVARSPVGEVPVIKRLIGLPGETVEIRAGIVYINGIALDEPYIRERARYSGFWTLGADEYFVMGDNRNRSTDSVDYGPLPRSRVQGVALFSYWPLNAMMVFTPPEY
jgi:signal peptidase I